MTNDDNRLEFEKYFPPLSGICYSPSRDLYSGTPQHEVRCQNVAWQAWKLSRARRPDNSVGRMILGNSASALAALADNKARGEGVEPVAVRHGWDGFGYCYLDSGSGSDWRTRHEDAEDLYTHSALVPELPAAKPSGTLRLPPEMELYDHKGDPRVDYERRKGWNACREAMLPPEVKLREARCRWKSYGLHLYTQCMTRTAKGDRQHHKAQHSGECPNCRRTIIWLQPGEDAVL